MENAKNITQIIIETIIIINPHLYPLLSDSYKHKD